MKTNKRWGHGARVDDLGKGKKMLLEAAVSCFSSKGVKATTIEDIANVANVTRRTVYRYFNGKPEIVAALVSIDRETMFQQMESVAAEYRDDFPRLLEECIWFAANYRSECEQQLKQADSRRTQELLPQQDNPESEQLWRGVLEGPLASHNQRHNSALKIEDIVPLAGRLSLIYRQHPVSKDEFHASMRAMRF
ncbi:MAG: TetR/AcrR family transcriptional regulator [Spongiibacter sp.]|uniref:TetR/AcrR family transcriptional regulator n=1 Tax=Spongiibacter thalassae TaxID=2721624 RepID=A0ABX1GG35_9GAMM|nr:TetR/AcrR family transcriptional regulator [Spongiibacter thalassae]MDX1504565.1 TetR/AcrR family transcriptional regulator [Spongiibacter sp.]NKI18133.1 TetR/AcrR family transcriptional regulator [Spongiibacter thalassae]